FVINIIAAFLGYLIRIVLARNLTVAEYGLFFAVFTLINLLAIFNHLGLGEALVKYIPDFLVKKKHDKIKNSIIVVLGTTFIMIIILAILLFTFSDFLAQNYFKISLAAPVLLLFILVLLFSNLRGLVRVIYQAFQRMTIYAVMYLAENSLILILLLCLFAFKKNIFIAVYSHIIAYVLIFIVFSLLLFKVFNFFKHKIAIKNDLVKKLFKFGIPVTLSGIGGMIILYTDTLILTYFRSLKEVGIYNVVVPTVMMIMFFGKSISSVIFPMASELWARKKKKYLEHGLIMLEKYSFVIVIPITLVVLAFSKLILSLMFGKQYSVGATTMQILLIGIIFFLIYSINSTLFASIGKPEIGTKILLQGALINFILNLLIIPKLGMLGAAITSLITYFYVFIVSVFKLRKFIQVKMPWVNWLKTFVSGMIMLTMMFILKKIFFMNVYLEAIIICIIAGIIYLGLILLMKIVDVKEVKNLVKMII
nr:flippase [Nanoarchaeota archaeon]